MPKQSTFATPESYYTTLYHQLMFATGHQSRLNRKGIVELNNKEVEPFSFEALVADIGASYLNSVTGIHDTQFVTNVNGIDGWIEAFKRNKRMIVYASSQAQRATDYILNVQSQRRTEEAVVDKEVETQ